MVSEYGLAPSFPSSLTSIIIVRAASTVVTSPPKLPSAPSLFSL